MGFIWIFMFGVVVGGLYDALTDYSVWSSIFAGVVSSVILAFIVYVIWLLGWFGNTVDTEKQVEASHRRIEEGSHLWRFLKRLIYGKQESWDDITTERTQHHDDH